MALRVCCKYNSVLFSYIGWLIDKLCTPSPPRPLAYPQTGPIGIEQGWEITQLLLAHLLIRSFYSNQMSDCERFAQIAQDK